MLTTKTFNQLGIAVVRGFISKDLLLTCCDYLEVKKDDYCKITGTTEEFPENDNFHPKTFSYYAPLCSEVLLTNSIDRIEKITGDSIAPSFSYARTYYKESKLERHTDRNGADYGVSICIDKDSKNWPLHIIDRKGDDQSIDLEPGDAVIFCGTELEHYREIFQGIFQTQIFLFYVSDRKDISCFFDGRNALGAPPATHIKERAKNNYEYK